MKIAVVGASGNAGSRIVTELGNRGHSVTAIARHPEKILVRENVTVQYRCQRDERGGHGAGLRDVQRGRSGVRGKAP